MRFTLDPLGDLDVPDGVTLGEVRTGLARLIGPATAGLPFTASGATLTDDQVAGAPPWAPGARVHLGPSGADHLSAAARSPWHIAVVAGPDAGAVVGPGPDGQVRIGRGGAEPGRLGLHDPAASREHAVVTRGRSRARWTVTDLGSANGTSLPGRRFSRVRRSRRLRPGGRVRVGRSVVELRIPVPAEPEPATASTPAVPMLTLAIPAVMSVVLALVTRNPLYLAFALTGVGAALPALLRRRRCRPDAGAPSLGPDPGRVAVALAANAGCDTSAVLDLARSGLAVVGPGGRPVTRALVASALLTQAALTVLVPPGADRRWSWLRWAGHRLGSASAARVARTAEQADRVLAGTAPTLLVVEHPGPWRTAVDRWWLRAGPDDAVIGLHPDATTVPGWCRWVLTVDDAGAALTGPGGAWPVDPPTASSASAERLTREVAARDARRRADDVAAAGDGADPLPALVSLADLVPTGRDAVLGRWRQQPDGLVVPLGVGQDGPFVLDLVTDGPHALVAGTTGAGKSELLQALVLGAALRCPPSDLAMVLVDFKGGASFGACRELPHVIGQVTDLDPVEAGRALDGLRWELRRRERLLAAAGVGDLGALRTQTGTAPPRLLVVVDEFRAVTEDLAEFIPGLVRLAAQGRSLGIHLVLATQRPAGAVDGQMRANLALRICLRVTEPHDSADVIDGPEAAALPAARPGRAVVRRDGGRTDVVQTAWAALRPGDRATVRWAPGWATFGTVGAERPADHCERLVDTVRDVAAAAGEPLPARVWLPPLPARVNLSDVDVPPGSGLVLGSTDPPGATRWGVLDWSGEGVLLVAGRDGSGRTTALRTVVDRAMAAGMPVHVLGAPASTEQIVGPDGARVGTVAGPEDPRLVGRLLDRLLDGACSTRTLLVVDDVAAVVRSLDRLPRGLGAELWDRMVREGRLRDVGLVVAGRPADLTRLAPHATDRLVLAVADPHDDTALGVPRELAAGRDVPGRAVHIRDQRAVRCHVGLPGRSPRPDSAALRLRPLPEVVHRSPSPWSVAGLLVGVGGDLAEDVVVPAGTSVLVVGPAGSGRSTAAATLAVGLVAGGHRVLTCADDGPLATVGRDRPDHHARTPVELHRLLDGTLTAGDGPVAVVVDDVERLTRTDPELDERLAALCCDPTAAVLVVATARTETAAAAYRGTCAALRSGGAVVVLAPSEAGSADVAGTEVTWAVDPVRPRHPGRGGVAHRGRLTPVQVALSGPG